ncbi:MAG: hypothetical protein NNA18_11615 [Nitrospira sp.]|nr:hypothetical protein [Nitrospira sp.]
MTPPLPQDLLPSLSRKQAVHHLYPDLADVPEPFLLEWFKDRYDYPRLHTAEELKTISRSRPEHCSSLSVACFDDTIADAMHGVMALPYPAVRLLVTRNPAPVIMSR